MSDAKLVNIARLMTTYNFEIEQLPDNLKCAQCKMVLKDACQLPCCCKFCRSCIDDMMARGGQVCPGDSEDCEESLLSRFVPDYLANKRVSRLTVKCPYDWCIYKCQLVNMEEHFQECQKMSEECPFHELGCTQDKLAAEEMGGHLQHENRRHSEILIAMIANINREIATLKEKDNVNSREIKTLKQRDEASSRDVEMLKHELVLRNEQVRSIMDQLIHEQNENKSIKNELKSIKEKIERETAERRENDELDSTRVIDRVNREIAVVTQLIGSNKDDLDNELQVVRGNIGSINQDVQFMKNDICSVHSQMQSVKPLMRDASILWLVNDNFDKKVWNWADRQSDSFFGDVHPYKYRLVSENNYFGTTPEELGIQLRIYPGPHDAQLAWPFEARVIVTVTNRDSHDASLRISQQCQIERPSCYGYRGSDKFEFLHSELKEAGLNLARGVCISCVIITSHG